MCQEPASQLWNEEPGARPPANPALCKSLCTMTMGSTEQGGLTWHLFYCMSRKENNLCLMEKETLRKRHNGEGEKKSLPLRSARHTWETVTGDAWDNLRMRKGQEMRGERDVWRKASRQFLRPTDGLGFHIDQRIQASSICKNGGTGAYLYLECFLYNTRCSYTMRMRAL